MFKSNKVITIQFYGHFTQDLCHICRWRDAIEVEYITSMLKGSTLNMCWQPDGFEGYLLGAIGNTFKMYIFQK